MLREDEVFRLAVLGYLGISDVQSSVRELVNVVNDLARNQLSMINTLNKVISIMQRGISIETKPTHFNTKYEFDIYGTNNQITIIGEAKTRAGPRTIQRLVNRVEELKRMMFGLLNQGKKGMLQVL